jgi:hypothetical protein
MPRNILPVRNGSFRLQKLNFSNRGFMDISMPPDFPLIDFRAFGIAAQSFFPKLLSDEDLNDPQEKLRHFQWAWQAVRYRYRLCYDSSEEFSALLINPNETWSRGGIDEELSYKLERCSYVFFISGVSIFDSLSFCLYFFGNALQSINFPYVDKRKKITLSATTNAFAASFPSANITERLRELSEQPEFTALEQWRNILAHRLAGRRSVRSSRTVLRNGTDESTWDERWYMPGPDQKLTFSEEMYTGEKRYNPFP